ncbi:MAG TPA: hypothetical protein PKW98_07175 [Candidatus Wallbacteria bacterium]|nr:hypothetical protein [Candidatus Wallbacteria bacterium]
MLGLNFKPVFETGGAVSVEGIGIWIAALLTLGIYSFLYKDNFVYKFSEYLFVGISAGYTLVLTFHKYLKPSLIEPLQEYSRDFYHIITSSSFPVVNPWMLDWQTQLIANKFGTQFQFIFWFTFKIFIFYLFPAILGLMMISRVIPSAAWLSRFPLATIVGYGSGIVIVTTLHASVLEQVKASFVSFAPLLHMKGIDWGIIAQSANDFILVFGLCCAIIYFYFSAEHKGVILGPASNFGIWVLMITFGASFGYTVMARISLLIGRFQFLLGDWMQLVK